MVSIIYFLFLVDYTLPTNVAMHLPNSSQIITFHDAQKWIFGMEVSNFYQ